MKRHWRLKTTLWLDVAMLVSVCALETVRLTGLVIHEWLGLAVVGMVLAHLLFSWSWIVTQSRRVFGRQSARERANYLLNLGLFAVVTAALFSGIVISEKAIPMVMGTKPPDMNMRWLRWESLHGEFAFFVLVLAGFHVAINLDWLYAAVGNAFRRFREASL